MDLSKLPKLSESPAPAPLRVDHVVDYPTAVNTTSRADLALDIIIALVLGTIFLMLGAPFGGWLIARMSGQTYETNFTWPDGSPVAFFDLQGGTAWLYFGEWVLGIGLLVAAGLLALASIVRKLTRPFILLAIVICSIGAIANIVAIVMQIKMGFQQPIISLVAVLIGAVMAFAPGRYLLPRR